MDNDPERILEDIEASYNQNTSYNFQNISREIGTKIFQRILVSLSTITDKAIAQQEIVLCDILKDLGIYLNGEGYDYTAYLNSGNIQFKAGNLEQAEADFEKAINLLPSYGVNTKEPISIDSQISVPFSILASVKYSLGENAIKNDKYDVALSHFRKSLDLSLQLIASSKDSKHSHNSFLSVLYSSVITTIQLLISSQKLGTHYNDAIYCLRKAKEYYNNQSEFYKEYLTSFTLASILSITGNNNDALTIMKEAKILIDHYQGNDLNQKLESIKCLCTLALYYQHLGLVGDAINKLDEAYQIASLEGDDYWKASCHVSKGSIYLYNLNSKKEAEKYYRRAISITSEKRGKENTQRILAIEGLAEIFGLRNDFSGAKSLLDEILQIPETNDSIMSKKASAYRQLADLYYKKGEFLKAEANYNQALRMYSQVPSRAEAETYNDLAYTMSKIGEFEKAVNYNRMAIEKFELLNDKIGIANSLIILSQIYLDSGDIRNALKVLEESKNSDTRIAELDPKLSASLFKGLGVIYSKSGDFSSSISNFGISLKYLDSIRASIKRSSDKIDFQSLQDVVYHEIIRLLIENQDTEKAYQHVQKAKSRILLEELRYTKLKIPDFFNNEDVWEKETRILQELRGITTSKGDIQSATLERMLTLEKEIEGIWDSIINSKDSSSEIKEYVALRRGDIITSSEIIQILSRRDKSTIVEYYILDNKLLIFVVDRNLNQLQIFSENIRRKDLEEMVRKLTNIISCRPYDISKDRLEFAEADFSKLETILLDPIKHVVKETEHMHIIPHGILHNLPFHALPWEKFRLIERYTVSYSPSTSVLRYCVNRSNNLQSGLAIGGSPKNDLIYARATAKKISEILGCDYITQNNASKENVISKIQDKDMISFDCHAVFDEKDALESHIELPYSYESERITAREFFSLRIPASIISLSACNSGKSDLRPGDEMFGLIRSFLFAGTKSVIAALWKLNDLSAYFMMVKFYHNLLVKDMNKAQSLRDAQLYVRNLTIPGIQHDIYALFEDHKELDTIIERLSRNGSKPFDQYYYWSPYILIGDWI